MNNLIIETKNLILLPWNIEDATDMQRILNDETISKMLDTPYPYTLNMAMTFINNIKNRTKEYYEWKIVLKSENKIIGGTAMDLGSNPVNLTHIYIDKNYRNFGYGTEIWEAKIKYCFENTNANELVSAFYKDNIASYKMQKKSGMIIENNLDENSQLTTKIFKK